MQVNNEVKGKCNSFVVAENISYSYWKGKVLGDEYREVFN